jgi:hypothetical protein
LWLASSASEGASLRVVMKNCETRMVGCDLIIKAGS